MKINKIFKTSFVALALAGMLALTGCSTSPKENTEAPAVDPLAQEIAVDPAATQPVVDPAASPEATQATVKTLKKIQDSGKLILGSSADFAPYEFHDLSSGEDKIVGFDIMIAEEIAKDLGVTLEIADKDFELLIPELTTGKVDIILSGMNSTAERKEIVDFSRDYYFAKQCVVVRAADLAKYTTIESLKDQNVGAQTGSLQLGFATDQIAPAGAIIFDLPNVQNLGLELTTGKIEALVLDLPVAEAMVKQNKELVISTIPITGDESGFAIALAKGNEDLLEKLNSVLDRLEAEGKLDEFMVNATNINN